MQVAFDDFALREGDDLDLEVGAILIARDEYPTLSVGGELARLDQLARGLGTSDLGALSPDDAARALTDYLYEQVGFRGNEEAYGDPRNSYLNDVLDRRLGIPISLAVVLLALARRRGVRAYGVSFPGHFLVRVERVRGGPLVLDPFFGGRILPLPEISALLRKTAGVQARLQLGHLKPAPPRAILVRMLQNLKAAHVGRGDLARALVAATRIVALSPRDPWAVRDRGVLQAQLGSVSGARADLLRYLELTPDAPDAASIRQVLARLPARATSLN
jgi:regulator of sirC expression with transglutaminase-like and TPR domain